MMDNALRAHEGQDLDAHRDDVAQVWSELSRAAVENADAWRPEYVDPKTIRDPSPQNAMMNFPYTKLHNSNWNVDQASGIVFCSAETAERLGIPRERWVFPLSVAESNHMTFSDRAPNPPPKPRICLRRRACSLPRRRLGGGCRASRTLQLLSLGDTNPTARNRPRPRGSGDGHRRHALCRGALEQLRPPGPGPDGAGSSRRPRNLSAW